MTALLVANDGGHLAQLKSLAKRLPIADAFRWVTVPTPQSLSLLEGEDVLWVKPGPTRDLRAALHNAVLASSLFRRGRISAVVSTGSSLAVSVLPQARLHGTKTYYIESATRTHGPSLSGRLLARIPGVELYTQNASWASKKWKYAGSVFDGWEPEQLPERRKVSKVVVSLGTSRTYGFRRLVESIAPLLQDLGAEVLWQTGTTDTTGLPVLDPVPRFPPRNCRRRCARPTWSSPTPVRVSPWRPSGPGSCRSSSRGGPSSPSTSTTTRNRSPTCSSTAASPSCARPTRSPRKTWCWPPAVS